MSVILVIQPDAAQSRVLHDVARRIGAELVIVDSTRRAVDAIARQVPDLILLSAFLSPRDEDTLMDRLRSLEGASHLQTMTIPQFSTGEERAKKSGFGFRKKQKAPVAVGADPAGFAEEVVALLSRASEIRNRPAPAEGVRTVIQPEPELVAPASAVIDDDEAPHPAEVEEPVFMNTLVAESSPEAAAGEEADSVFSSGASAFADDAGSTFSPDADAAWRSEVLTQESSPVLHRAALPSKPANSIADEIDNLVRQLGLDVKLSATGTSPAVPAAAAPPDEHDNFDFAAALDRARNNALTRSDDVVLSHPDADAIRESAMAEGRAIAEREARETSAREIARVQAEGEALRRAAEARAAAERQAHEALAADLARAQTEAEEKRELALAEARAAEARAAAERQAREALAADLARAQREAEQKRELALAEARAAEARAEEERKARERLAADLARAQREAEQRREAEQKREAALAEARAAEARAEEERKAREKLAADLARTQREAEQKREQALAEARAAEARAAEERRAREALAADLARAESEAEQKRQLAIAEARAVVEREAREALAADLARVQVEAEQMRERAMADARASAERESREALEVEVARVRSEAQSTFTDALNKVKVEAEEAERRRAEAERISAHAQEAFARELLRVRTEVEQSMTAQLDAARAEAERVRAAEAEAVRERAAMEAQLKNELDRLKFVTTQARKADESDTKKAAQQIKQLEAELASVRAKAEDRKGNELEDLRAQMAEMREAAAQHARAAAADAVAAAVAAATPRQTAVIAQFPMREIAAVEPDEFEEEEEEAVGRTSRDYLSLWQPKSAAAAEPEQDHDADDDEYGESVVSVANIRRHAKWALPVAACLILVINTGTAISTVSSMSSTVSKLVEAEEKPDLVVQPLREETPFIEVVETRVGKLQVDSTPSGAEAILDGQSYGKTPLTIPDLEVGLHTLQLKSPSGTITRKVTIRANQTTMVAEGIYSGWLAIFSPIPVKVLVDGAAVSLTEDGRAMTTPGPHVVEFINEHFNYRVSERLDVRPGETTPHTLKLPMGTVRVTAPEGAAIFLDGQPTSGIPSEGLSVSIGSHEISARHPELGERRMPVDVKHGGLTEVTLRFE